MNFERDDTFPIALGQLVDSSGFRYRADEQGYVFVGDISRNLMGKQGQYGSRYFGGDANYPNLAEGLRFEGEDEYDKKMHPDDIDTFLARYASWRTVKALDVTENGEHRTPTEEELHIARVALAEIDISPDQF